MSTLQTKQSKKKITKQEILDLIDFEIDVIKEEEEKPGWTTWALIGGLATIIWLILEEANPQNINVKSILLLVLGLFLLVDVLKSCSSLLSIETTEKRRGLRFILTYRLGTYREFIVLSLMRYAAIFTIVLVYQTLLPKQLARLILLYSGISALTFTIIIILSYIRFPLPIPLTRKKIASKIIELLGTSALIYIFANYSYWLFLRIHDIVPEDFRISILLVTGFFILLILSKRIHTPPMLQTLIETRRDLSLDLIDVHTASHQLEISMMGMRISDVLQDDVHSILDNYKEISKQLNNFNKELDIIIKNYPPEKEYSNKEYESFKKATNTVEIRIKSISKVITWIEKARKRFERRVHLLMNIESESKSEIEEIRNYLQTEFKDVVESKNAINKKWKRFYSEWEDYMKDRNE